MAYASLDDSKRLDHPVWMVYNMQRTACFNAKYYGHKLRSLERQSRLIDAIIAIAAPTSGIAGLAIWQSSYGKEIWAWIPTVATFLIVYKAATKTTNKLKELEKRVTAYQSLICLDSWDHVPIRSWPLFKARNVLRTLFQSDFSLATR